MRQKAMPAESLHESTSTDREHRLKTAGNAGMGAAFGVLIYQLFQLLHHLLFGERSRAEAWPVWLAALIVASIELRIFRMLDPVARAVRSRLHAWRPSFHALGQSEESLKSVLDAYPAVLAALVLAYTLVRAARGESTRVEEPFSLVMVGVIAAVMTWYWWEGVRRQPRDARWLGTAAGVVTGALFAIAAVILFGRGAPFVPVMKQVIRFALSWGLYGFGGGMALDRGGVWRPGVRAGIGVAAAVLALGLVNGLFDRPFPWWEEACLAAGLGAGLIVLQPSDGFLAPPRSSRDSSRL
ncbi:MAG TPA: hypothetical protein VFW01_02965 [bacterium]|nr:hypothetical protein [bacterium]